MKILLEKFTSKKLFFVSLGVIGYFCLLFLNAYVVKSDLILIGVFQELLTLPLMMFQLTLLVFSVLHWIKDRFRIKTYSFVSLLILLASNFFILASFYK